jgi:hypothetical protein
LKPLLRDRIVSENMVEEMSLSGHNASFSISIYQTGDFDGIHCVLSDFVFMEKPRVKKHKHFFTC